MDIEELVAHVNAHHRTQLRLRHRYDGGENQGAYALADADDQPLVLKCNDRPPWLARIALAARITDHLRTLGAPVPRYVVWDALPDGTAYWLQTALPGRPPEHLAPAHVTQLLATIELQAGQARSAAADWSAYVRAVVFHGESGWAARLDAHSDATRDVRTRLERLVAGRGGDCFRRTDDIVHGDLGIANLLVDGDTLTGIIDWDAAGCGDRALDLVLALFSDYDHPAVRAPLTARVLGLAGVDGLCVGLAYATLGQLDWSIRHHPPASVDDGVALAHRIIADCAALAAAEG